MAIDEAFSLDLDSYASMEAQVAAFDDIAYLAHDCDDGIRAGWLIRMTCSIPAAGRADPEIHFRYIWHAPDIAARA